jgi:hypothetical protein
MKENKVFLATTGNGLARAICREQGEWVVEYLLEDQDVCCLTAVPHTPTIYAGTQGSGLLCSNDCGKSWQAAGLFGHIIKSLAVSPQDPNVVYVGTKPPCIFVSRDRGETWAELEAFRRIRGYRWWRSPAEPPDWRAYVQAVSISPTDPNRIVAGIEFGAVVCSIDGGQTWSNHRKGALRDCHSLTFHATQGDWVYEAGGGGTAVSRDGGETWQQPRKGLGRTYGWACAADSERPEVWYFSAGPFGWKGVPQPHIDGKANASIYRSAGGASWQKLTGGLPQPLDYMAYALITDQNAPGHIYVGLSNGDVWHSVDYGDSWQKLPFNLSRIHRTMILIK